jgi:hypothetical protein
MFSGSAPFDHFESKWRSNRVTSRERKRRTSKSRIRHSLLHAARGLHKDELHTHGDIEPIEQAGRVSRTLRQRSASQSLPGLVASALTGSLRRRFYILQCCTSQMFLSPEEKTRIG